ncbi:hypothetical protein F8568_020755 [Actinomadura sp. LD22]|uniref:Uncharacterized protein n=1 Tax=Actinomadura physcomitrii TaxID=2650748 RepID=A0A6I4MGA4_9ACTN|nr:hypothetical protein [Actinomadura physcomitrii]MWA02761.1 hypothetical protein [Actinomadura physcomitrii]
MAYETTPRVRARMRRERRALGWDIPRMAQELRNAADYPHKMPSVRSLRRYIERWEEGDVVRITERYRILYARALNMDEDELFQDGHKEPANRNPSAGDVEAIRGMLTALMTSDRQFGGARIRQQATDYLTDVIEPRLRGHAPEALRRRLFAISTEFAMRVSAMNLDTDRLDASLMLLGRAASMANESGDASLTAWVLARRGEHEMHKAALATRPAQRADHVQQALAYTEGAVGVARTTPPLGRAFLTTKSALASSLTGDRARTQRILGNVWDAYRQAGTAEEPSWMGAYGWGHLRHEEARCYVNLGMGRDAARSAEESLSVRTDLRPRAFSLGILSIAHAQTLDIEQACVRGHEMLALAAQISSRRICVRVTEMLAALAAHRDHPSVIELREAAQPVLADCAR